MAKKDLIIGAFKNYSYNTIKPWVESIRECGFEGDKVIVSIGSSESTNQKLADEGFHVLSGESQSGSMFHMERFIHIYQFLKQNALNYRYVITTDVRDVIFQTNPIPYVETILDQNPLTKLIAVSEGIKIKDESWNRENIIKSFGPYFYDDIKESEVLNVGTLVGTANHIRDLCGIIFQLSMNRADWVADQAAYNILMNWIPYNMITHISKLSEGFACNLHVTNKPDQLQEFGPYLLEERPIFEDGLVKDGKNKQPFAIVHQYDRVPEMLDFYKKKYQQDEYITINT